MAARGSEEHARRRLQISHPLPDKPHGRLASTDVLRLADPGQVRSGQVSWRIIILITHTGYDGWAKVAWISSESVEHREHPTPSSHQVGSLPSPSILLWFSASKVCLGARAQCAECGGGSPEATITIGSGQSSKKVSPQAPTGISEHVTLAVTNVAYVTAKSGRSVLRMSAVASIQVRIIGLGTVTSVANNISDDPLPDIPSIHGE